MLKWSGADYMANNNNDIATSAPNSEGGKMVSYNLMQTKVGFLHMLQSLCLLLTLITGTRC